MACRKGPVIWCNPHLSYQFPKLSITQLTFDGLFSPDQHKHRPHHLHSMDQQILPTTSSYALKYGSEPKRLEAMLKLLQAYPEANPVTSLVPLDEHEARLDAIINIRDTHRSSIVDPALEFTRVQFFYLIRMSVTDL